MDRSKEFGIPGHAGHSPCCRACACGRRLPLSRGSQRGATPPGTTPLQGTPPEQTLRPVRTPRRVQPGRGRPTATAAAASSVGAERDTRSGGMTGAAATAAGPGPEGAAGLAPGREALQLSGSSAEGTPGAPSGTGPVDRQGLLSTFCVSFVTFGKGLWHSTFEFP